MPKDSKHRLIFRENIRLKPRYPGISSDSHEMSQDETRDANAPIVAVGRKGEFGANRAHSAAREASSANQDFAILSLRCGHQCDHLAEIYVGQLLELCGR